MRGVTPKNARRHPKKCEASPQKMRGVTPKNARRHPKKCEASPQKMRGVTPTPPRSHPENGGMAPHQFFENNYFSEANQLRVFTVHEGHMGHYHHWRTDDSSSSCFSAILNVGKMRGVTPTDAMWAQASRWACMRVWWLCSCVCFFSLSFNGRVPLKLLSLCSGQWLMKSSFILFLL